MVSFYKALTESPISEVNAEFEASSRKRKWEEPFAEEFFKDQMNLEKKKSFFDIEPRLETPFTSDKWRQYLSIQVCIVFSLDSNISKKTLNIEKNSNPTSTRHK